jgi:hypothetical protein
MTYCKAGLEIEEELLLLMRRESKQGDRRVLNEAASEVVISEAKWGKVRLYPVQNR